MANAVLGLGTSGSTGLNSEFITLKTQKSFTTTSIWVFEFMLFKYDNDFFKCSIITSQTYGVTKVKILGLCGGKFLLNSKLNIYYFNTYIYYILKVLLIIFYIILTIIVFTINFIYYICCTK